MRKTIQKVTALLVLSVILMGAGSAAPVPSLALPEDLALAFVLESMRNEAGGIFTQWQPSEAASEEQAGGHDVMAQNHALLLRYAEIIGDHTLFETQRGLLQKYFLDERVNLFYWKLDAAMNPFLSSQWGTYSNTPINELIAIDALLAGYDRWGEDVSLSLAGRIGAGLRDHVVDQDGRLRDHFAWPPQADTGLAGNAVVLPYLHLPAMDRLAGYFPQWKATLAVNLDIALGAQTEAGLFHELYLPDAQTYSSGSGSLTGMAQLALFLAEYGQRAGEPRAVRAAQRFFGVLKARYQADNRLFARYDPDSGQPLVSWENLSAYALIARLAVRLDEANFANLLVAEKLLPQQQLAPDAPVFGSIAWTDQDAFSFDTLHALIALETTLIKQPLSPQIEGNSVRAAWYVDLNPQAYARPQVPDELKTLKNRLCIDTVGFQIYVFQDTINSANPHIDPDRTAPDPALRQAINAAHAQGLRVMLLPVLFVDDGSWEGVIRPDDLDQWFEHWTEVVVHYAKLAQRYGVEMLQLGSELVTLRKDSKRWGKLIATVRQHYQGHLSYSVNFWANRSEYREIKTMDHWAALDSIGVVGYFELTNDNSPSLEGLERAWRNDRNGQDVVSDLRQLHEKYDKPIVLWEVGYQSKDGTNTRPWDFFLKGLPDQREQLLAYQALLNVFEGVPWFSGLGMFGHFVGLPKSTDGYDLLDKQAEGLFAQSCR